MGSPHRCQEAFNGQRSRSRDLPQLTAASRRAMGADRPEIGSIYRWVYRAPAASQIW